MAYHFRSSFFSDNTSEKYINVISDYDGVPDRIDIRPPKIIVGVSITVPEEEGYHRGVFTVPAIIDTGCNRAFMIDKRHLELWAGVRAEYLPSDGKTRFHEGRPYRMYTADVHIHKSSYKLPLSSHYPMMPYHLKSTKSITVMEPTTDEPDPRLPLLGLRALVANRLQLSVDTRSGSFTLTSSRKIFAFHI